MLADPGRSREEMRWWGRAIPNSGLSTKLGRRGHPADGAWPDSRARPCLGACAGGMSSFSNPFSSGPTPARPGRRSSRTRSAPAQVKVGLVLPLSAAGNAGVAAQSMKNAAEMALAEFQNPNIQLLIKDDAGNPQGAQQGTQQALDEGAEIILGPLFAAVGAGDGAADAHPRRLGDRVLDRFERGRPRRLSAELPAGVRRQPHRRIRRQHRQSGRSRRCCRTTPTAMWSKPRSSRRSAAGAGASSRSKNTAPTAPRAARTVAQALGQADALFIADDGDSVVAVADALTAAGRQSEKHPAARHRPVGQSAGVREPGACRAASMPRRIRPASAVSPAATAPNSAPIRCAPRRWPMTRWRWSRHWRERRAAQRFSPEVLTNPSGFAGIDGLFRFRADGTNERGLAVMRVGSGGSTPVAGSPKSFGA